VPACGGGRTCQDGLCACPAELTECGTVCTDLTLDQANCHGCGQAARSEECNGRDDDCNGLTDDALTPPADPCAVSNVAGTCSGSWQCTVTGWSCDAATPVPETCNGLDDDSSTAAPAT